MTKTRLQPWPEELLHHYMALLDEIDELRSLYKTCLDLGIIDHRYGLFSVFVKRIQDRLKNVRQLCRVIRRHYKLSGRPPKWYLVVEEVFMTANELTDDLRLTKNKIRENRWLEVEALMRQFIARCERITKELETINLPPDLELYRNELKEIDLSLD